MKKKIYTHPVMNVVEVQPQRMIATSPEMYGMRGTLQDVEETNENNLVEEAW